MNDKEYYTTEQIAEMLLVDVQTVRRYIRQGKIKVVKLNSKMIRIPRQSVDYLLKEAK